MIKNLIFDMGQVLIEFDPDRYISLAGADPADIPLLRSEVFRSPEWYAIDRGSISPEQGVVSVRARLPKRLHATAEDLILRWWQYGIFPIAGMGELIAALKREGYKIYLLSNASSLFYNYFSSIPGSGLFDGLLVSSDYGLLKPQHEIYEKLFSVFKLLPEDCLFIDDQPQNIEGASICGMQGIVFRGDVNRLSAEIRERCKPAAASKA